MSENNRPRWLVNRERSRTALIISRWSPEFKRQFGGSWPQSYFCFDLETSGFSHKDDVIVQWGHCLVRDRKVVDRNCVVLNWYESSAIPSNVLDYKLDRIDREMRADNRTWHVSPEVMRRDGVEPKKALTWMHELLTEVMGQGMLLVSHNGWKFDYKMLINGFGQDLGVEFDIGPNQMLDTGAVEKASQAIDDPRSLPAPGENLKDYCIRVANSRMPGIKWNLDQHCIGKYGLGLEHGLNATHLHDAGTDAFMLHLLMEKFRGMIEQPSDWQQFLGEAEKQLLRGRSVDEAKEFEKAHLGRFPVPESSAHAVALQQEARVYRRQRNR